MESVKADGTVLPWCIGSKYVSGRASDGLLRSQPDLKPERKQSHNNINTNYQKKGEGYQGAGACRNTFQILFNIIKGTTKNSQTLYAGCTNYSYQYDAAAESAEKHTYFPVTNAQADTLVVGSSVSVGYGGQKDGALYKDRGLASIHQYADSARILKIEPLDENNKAVYLDIPEEDAFDTMSVNVTDTIISPIILTTMHWYSGATDKVKGRHDGSILSNSNSKCPYRVQGREYAVGGYIIASDTVMDFQSDYSKNVYVAQKGVARSTSDTVIRNTYKLIGSIPGQENGADFYVGDVGIDTETGAWYPCAKGSSSSQGYGDYCYAGGKSTSGTREYLQGGSLGDGSHAGSAFLYCWNGLAWTHWYCLGCD